MGCFMACFGTSTHRKSKKSATSRNQNNKLFRGTEKSEPAEDAKPTEEPIIHVSVKPISESSENKAEQFNTSNEKKITFNLINGFNEDVQKSQEVANCTPECEEKYSSRNEVEMDQVQEAKEENGSQSQTFSDSCNSSSMISYPPMHRYHNCTSSEDDHQDTEIGDTGNINDGGNVMTQEESSGSLFSLSIESRKQFNRVEVDDNKEVTSPLKAHGSSEKEMKWINLEKKTRRVAFDESEVKSPQKPIDSPEREMISIGWNPNPWDRIQYAGSVLNPVENLTQWKAAKARTTTHLCSEEKENVILDQELNTIRFIPKREEPNFKRFFHPSKENADPLKTVDNDIPVDTSLSSWLAESEKAHLCKEISSSSVGNYSIVRENSLTSFEDRPISGSLPVEEVKQVSASSSSYPIRSPNRNPDEMPLIGTVGSYWRHTKQASDSSNSGSSFKGRPSRPRKFSQDKAAAELSCYTPLETS